ncbi:ABC transporter substrate-binding protein [Cupriavidus sp. 30B13]|uniref:ABC transporter substrate-binding protein n=1 Tax=Cupriavidus sp. 30B13 TaxID=3384241 RepID=UPI003B8FB250
MPDELWHLHGAWWLGADVLPGRAAAPRPGSAALRPASFALVLAIVLWWLLAGLPWRGQPAPGPLLRQAQARGELVVGVHAYPRATPPGRPLVPEPDPAEAALAAELGRALGVPVRLRHLPQPADGRGTLPPGTDLSFGGPAATQPRAAFARAPAIPPGTLLTLRFTPVDRLAMLAGKTACVSQDSPYQAALARAGATLRRYPSALQALLAFRRGDCAAVAEDAALAARVMRLPEWRFFAAAPLLVDGAGPLLALRQADAQSARFLEQWLAGRRRDGLLARWRDAAAGDAAFNMMLVESGLICH